MRVSSTAVAQPPVFSRLAVVVIVIGMLLLFLFTQLLGVYIAGFALLPEAQTLSALDILARGGSDGTIVSWSVLFSAVVLSALSIALIRWHGASAKDYLALRPITWRMTLGMLGLWLAYSLVSQALTYVLDQDPMLFMDVLYQSVSNVWLLVVVVVIVAPIYEELVFRGLLWSAIAEQFASSTHPNRGALVASVLTSVLFAGIHLQYGWYELGSLVVLALLFAYARFRSGSLLLPIILHMVNNGVAMWQFVSQMP
ncbi:CPBP family intramembrane glutamic endopeptidase [Psychrobacter aestuarii]|uniref:CPBP family intramembrane metalloprotease n=1 Tax=Psychrobacter aestuarii TaxID=556327 RepID=A0ABP3FCB8_9GAMM|nr:CPBP family intramembrane glutamic endopeptidase [Psychrobacter aestuarii]